MPKNVERITFPGAGGHALAGRLHRPPGPLRGCALFAHCFTCGKDLRVAERIASRLAGHGIATLRFDFTGLGQSEGEFADTTFSSNIDDLLAAADAMRKRLEGPAILIGHSLGGAAVLAAADRIPEARAIATLGAPADPTHVEALLGPKKEELEAKGEAEVLLAGRPFRIKKAMLDDLREHADSAHLASLKRALLVFHSPQDNTVGIENARLIYNAAKHPKSFVSLDGADHLLSRAEDAAYVAEVLVPWAMRYVRPAANHTEHGDVRVEGRHGFQQHIQMGPHELLADEPRSVGGEESGPGPYDLLLASLGACTSMTLRMYADRKKWPLEGVSVTLRHERVHAKDCEECESETGLVDRIEKRIALRGPLDAAQRARLLEIADRCPVHRTLHNEIRIESALVEQE